MVCFDRGSHKNCELFDGTSSTPTHSAQFLHHHGSLGYYKGQPTTVGCYYSNGQKKVETYSTSGWTSLADHPRWRIFAFLLKWFYFRNIRMHTLTGLESGAMLMAGGYDNTNKAATKDIWLFKEDVWSLIGSLKEVRRNFTWKFMLIFDLVFLHWLSTEDWKLHLPSLRKKKRFECPLPGGTNQNSERRTHRNRSHRRTRVWKHLSSYLRSNRRFLRLKSAFFSFSTFKCYFISASYWS